MKKALIGFLGSVCLGISSLSIAAESYPDKAVTIVVPYAPGGTTDVLARLLAEKLGEQWSKPVVVQNKTGAGGNIAASYTSRASGDGYTLMMASIGQFAINPIIFSDPGYDPKSDFIAVAAVAEVPNLLITKTSSKIDSLESLIETAKQKPGEIAFASSGNGSSNHLAGVLLSQTAGIDLLHVPYKGSAPGLQALYSGDVQVMFDNLSSALPHVKSGQLQALASTSLERFPQLPDLPTIDELGLSGYEASAWFGIVAPAGTPPAVVEKINTDINAILQDPTVAKRLADMGVTPMSGTAEDFSQVIDADMKKWSPIVLDANLAVN